MVLLLSSAVIRSEWLKIHPQKRKLLCPSKFFPSENVIRRLLKQLTITSSEWSGRSRQPMRPTCWPVMWGEKCTGLLQQLPLLTKGSKTLPSQASLLADISSLCLAAAFFSPSRAPLRAFTSPSAFGCDSRPASISTKAFS
jgi:hypothetical protein